MMNLNISMDFIYSVIAEDFYPKHGTPFTFLYGVGGSSLGELSLNKNWAVFGLFSALSTQFINLQSLYGYLTRHVGFERNEKYLDDHCPGLLTHALARIRLCHVFLVTHASRALCPGPNVLAMFSLNLHKIKCLHLSTFK
jgi:hypothetical protein